ncbi:hypothetical protein NQ314_018963 [Rhamnusium bicolor]|uniref:DDE Tnp4 domain-containing protein n=1 Tax=Rhamnusium bicolor TaxID=1586634 RepID=A0AAV8WQP7_9CUCU|nr:hypothetical protein NQ314_018963 [Rhamnusium bicolor]
MAPELIKWPNAEERQDIERDFREKQFPDTLAEKCGDYYILGDSGYPCLRHLLTHYKDRGQLTRVERIYNYKLSARYKIEHCFDHAAFCTTLPSMINFTYDENAEVNLADAIPEIPYNEEEVERDDLDGIRYRNFKKLKWCYEQAGLDPTGVDLRRDRIEAMRSMRE